MAQIEEIMGELDALGLLEAVKPHWEESLASFPDGVPDFLQPEQVRTNLQWCGFRAEFEPAFTDAAQKIAASRSLRYLAWHYYRMVYDYETDHLEYTPLQKMMGEDWPIFYLLIALAMVPRIRAHHRGLGIPEWVTKDCCLKVKDECNDYRRGRGGRLGIFRGELSWLSNYVNGEPFYRLGRFEYWSKPFPHHYKVYRSRQDGRIIALAGPGWRINSSGWIDGVGAETEDASLWQTTLRQIGSSVHGFPINPRGFVEKNPVTLQEGDWECVLEKGVPVLEMHIPAGERITLERCAESLRKAKQFFQTYFPAPAARAIICSSWMFSPLLGQLLPADSNLVRFMRELYLCPTNSRSRSGPWFIFLQEPFNLATAPRETSLQRAILNYLQAGNLWRDGRMFFMLDDLDHFGSQLYQKSI
jgi:hypothetical protein